MIESYRLIVHGQVHGVGYRYSTKRQADRLGLSGFVQNQSDGTVLIEIEGEAKNIQRFIRWCHGGPKQAEVKQIEVLANEHQSFVDFQIKN